MNSTDTRTTTYVVAQRNDQFFGFDARFVSESSTRNKPTTLPGTCAELVGVVNLRNTVLPIILPDRWLLTEPVPYSEDKPITVINYKKTTFGLQLDSIHGVQTANQSQHHPHPYQAETGYFSNLVMLSDGTLFTAIDIELLIQEINTLTL